MNSTKEKTTEKAIKRFCAAALLLCAGVGLFFTFTLAWFNGEKNPRAEKIDAGVFGGYALNLSVSLDSGTTWTAYNGQQGVPCNFVNFFSGYANSKVFMIRCVNNDTRAVFASLFFRAPVMAGISADEIPFFDATGMYGAADTYYYLGSQLQISEITAAVDGVSAVVLPEQAAGKDSYLVKTELNGQGKPATGVSAPVTTVSEHSVVKDFIIAPGETAVLTLTLTLIDNGKNQNVYQSEFYTDSIAARCRRTLVFIAGEV